MHAPAWICEALYKMHPYVRLAWCGREKVRPDEMNAGSFALVQLYHISDAGKVGDEQTFFTLWDEPGICRGPIFNRHGGCSRDWDPLFRVPVLVAKLDDFQIDTQQVFSGKFLLDVRRWLTPIKKRIRESYAEKKSELKRTAEDITREATDYLWKQAQRSDATTVIKAQKHCKEELKAWEVQKQQAATLGDYYNVPMDSGD